MPAFLRDIAITAMLATAPTLVRADESLSEAPPTPSPPSASTTPPGPASSPVQASTSAAAPSAAEPSTVVEPAAPTTTPGLTPEEERQIVESLGADAAAQAQPSGAATGAVPDLSKINAAQVLSPVLQGATPDISFILDAAGAWFSSDKPQQLGGHDPKQTGFNLQQLELAVGSSVDPFFRFDSNIVFSQFGVELEEAYATTLALPANLQVRAGQFLTRVGRQNASHVHSWHFLDQPLVLGKFMGSEGNRGLGTELSWLAPLPWFAEVVGSVTNADGACCARSWLGAENIGVKTPLDLLATVALEQFFPLSDALSLMAGLSAQSGPNPTGNANRTELFALDLYLRYRPLDATSRWSLALTVEAMLRQRQIPFGLLRDGGGYAQLIWQIDPSWESGARYELVTGVHDDPLDPDWTDLRHRGAGQLTWYPSHFSRLRLQGSVDAPTWQAEPIYAVVLALEVLVGAHGAHAY